MMRFLSSTAFWQLAACLTGVVASAVPCVVIHRGFWDYRFAASSSDTRGVRIEQIQPNTPAAALHEKDRIIAVNGREDAIYDLNKSWRDAPVGSEVEFRVMRGEPLYGDIPAPSPFGFKKDPNAKTAEEVVVRIPRVPDPVAGRVYWHWQLPAALTFLGLGLIVLVTCSFSRASRWRGAIILAGAVTLLVVLFAVNWKYRLLAHNQRIAWTNYYSYIDPLPWQKVGAVAACGALALLGAVGLLTTGCRRESVQVAEPTAAADPARDVASPDS